jgi:NTE family protein
LCHPPDQSADHADRPEDVGYRFEVRRRGPPRQKENLVILAFSGGGTRAAAFSYGVLEFLRRTEVTGPQGQRFRLLDQRRRHHRRLGRQFHGAGLRSLRRQLFDEYEQRFLKRDVQGEIIARTFSPRQLGPLWLLGWGRSELAAELYDEILFNGCHLRRSRRAAVAR